MGWRTFALLRALTCNQALRCAVSRADLRERSSFSIAFQTIIDSCEASGRASNQEIIMAKHANKTTRSMSTSQRSRKNAKCLSRLSELEKPEGCMRLKMHLLNCSGIDQDLAAKWAEAIAQGDLAWSMIYAEVLNHEAVNPFTLRWNCELTKPNLPTSIGVVNAFKLAHTCGSKFVLAWLISIGLSQHADEAQVALTDLVISFGDGSGGAPGVDFAREVFEFLFSPKTADDARGRLDDLQVSGILGPHVESLVKGFCLSFLANEEESLMRAAAVMSQAFPNFDANVIRL
jgi:hypothetical protein